MQLPEMPAGLTPDWLTETLRTRGILEHAKITAVQQTQVGDGTGMMSELCRLSLTFEGDPEGFPDSLIAKFPCQNQTNREVAMAFNLYEREVRYFAEINAQTPAYSPPAYFTAMEGSNFIILMRDMAAYRVGDQAAGASLEDTVGAVDELAKLHGSLWGRVDHLDWVPHIADSYHADNMFNMCATGWSNMCEIFSDYLDPSIPPRGTAFQNVLARLQTAMNQTPVTFLHGDFRMENLFFGTQPGHQAVAIIDWQGPLRGRGMVDVALMLGQSTRTEVRQEHEQMLTARYAAGLRDMGIQYTDAQAWEEYRLALLYNWVYVSVVAGTLDVHNERAFAWMSQMVARQSQASMDLDVFSLM